MTKTNFNFGYTRMLNTINRIDMEKENILNKCLILLLGQKHEKTYVSHFIFNPYTPAFLVNLKND